VGEVGAARQGGQGAQQYVTERRASAKHLVTYCC
jgi:hypothetical protein